MKYILLCTLIFPLLAIAQHNLKGKVISNKTKQPVAFATIGLVKQNIGINADENGYFELNSAKYLGNDTLLISSVGFEWLKVPVSKFENIIVLQEKDSVLKDVVVVSKKDWKTATLNDFKKCGNYFYGTTGSQTQIGRAFHLPANKGYLKEVKLCQMSGDFIGGEKTIFRIRVYSVDSVTKVPAEDLCDQIIEVKTSNKTIRVNLEKYHIFIPDSSFIVALEWLRIPYNERKQKTFSPEGKLVDGITYTPSIGWAEEELVNTTDVWYQNYTGKWRHNITGNRAPRIAVNVKY